MKRFTAVSCLFIAVLLIFVSYASAVGQKSEYGPENGALVIVGGGNVGKEIINRFIELAGGLDAPIVVIPTAGGSAEYNENNSGLGMFKTAGVKNIQILHTNDRKTADTEEFVKPLKTAKGVWIGGGRQWRLTDIYLNTLTHKEMFNVLERGGVIGGSSAGASVQASYMVRGAPEGNTIMMAKGHEEGFGFIKNVAVDQHINTRSRFNDLNEVIKTYPILLGIGLYESTAIIVQKNQFEVIGAGKVAIHDNKRTIAPGDSLYYLLDPGTVFDMKERKIVK
jgi:cyanophycinase